MLATIGSRNICSMDKKRENTPLYIVLYSIKLSSKNSRKKMKGKTVKKYA